MSEITSQLLFVPFNNDYVVDKETRESMTEEEFFKKCFVRPNMDAEIEHLLRTSIEVDETYDCTTTFEDINEHDLRRLQIHKNSYNHFCNWLENDGTSLYCVTGDAGSGKTTYLHYLKYCSDQNIVWEIVDIQKATYMVDVMGKTVTIPNFKSLDYKVISIFINNILQHLLLIGTDDKDNIDAIAQNIFSIYSSYKVCRKNSFPSEEVEKFFEKSPLFMCTQNEIDKTKLIGFSKSLCDFLNHLIINEVNSDLLIKKLLDLYICILKVKAPNKNYVIAFDNFERFIGTDEIYNFQLIKFIDNLRHYLETCYNEDHTFYSKCRILLFMRNTSIRMTNMPLQTIEFPEHAIDVSEWFAISEIINKKINWYKQKNILSCDYTWIEKILGPNNYDGSGSRSLKAKLGMLFNHNNRTILYFLDNIINSQKENGKYLDKYNDFQTNKIKIDAQLSRFAGRSIILRLILDEIKKDAFFDNILVQDDTQRTYRLGYFRKILTVLYTYSLEHENNEYMPLDSIIQILYNIPNHKVSDFFTSDSTVERRILSKILYYMNYYNCRKMNWLYFIDIQNNNGLRQNVQVSSDTELEDLLVENHSNINIKISTAGKAYLFYIVHSFEYFSCRNKDKRLPPLLCTIPTLDDIRNCSNVTKLECIEVIDTVYEDVKKCVRSMKDREDRNDFSFRRYNGTKMFNHVSRIVNSHSGYINNFISCVHHYFINKREKLTEQEAKKVMNLLVELNKRKKRYYLFNKI